MKQLRRRLGLAQGQEYGSAQGQDKGMYGSMAIQDIETYTLQSAATAVGNGSAVYVGGYNGAQMVEVVNTGTGTATVLLQGSYGTLDGSGNQLWYPVGYMQIDNNSNPIRTAGSIAVAASSSHVYQVLDLYQQLECVVQSVTGSVSVSAKAIVVAI